MIHLFIINPAAGSRDRTKEYTEKIAQVCAARGVDYRVEISAAPGDCKRIARRAAEEGKQIRLYACGGDGTLNEVAAGAAGFPNAAVTVFSGGSGNDFVRLFDDPKAFFDLERLMDCEEVEFDMIRCNDDLCINICSVGLDARIGGDVARYKRIPLLSGFRAYAVSSLVNVIRGVTEHYTVEIDGQVFDGKKTLVCACNGRFYGGGFCPVPDAEPDDGILDVLVVEPVSRLKVAKVIGKYKNGQYAQLPELIRHFRTKEVTITCRKPTPVNLDGEILVADKVHIRLAEEKLRFFYPKGLTWSKKVPAHK